MTELHAVSARMCTRWLLLLCQLIFEQLLTNACHPLYSPTIISAGANDGASGALVPERFEWGTPVQNGCLRILATFSISSICFPRIGDGGREGDVSPKIREKIFFGQISCKIRAFC